MLEALNFRGIAKAVLATAMPVTGTTKHWCASVDAMPPEPQGEAITASIAAHPMQSTARRGQEIRRSLPTREAAKWFVSEMRSRELTGERTWRSHWQFYLWICDEEKLVPLPEGMQARFAQELAKMCQRGQVRIREGGKLRRLTTYTIPDAAAAYLRAAA